VRRRRWATALVAALAAVLVVAGCRSDDHEAGGTAWAGIQQDLAGPLDRASANPCNAGSAACVAAVADEMRRRAAPQLSSCSHRAAFALMYLRVTEGVLHQPVDFADPAYVNHLDALFADLYFKASDAHRAKRTSAVPRAWQVAFQAADDRSVTGLGDLMRGMNAHIIRDLPFALVATGAGLEGGAADFTKVNEVLIDAQAPIVDEAAARLDPAIGETAGVALLFAREGVAATIAGWRAEALDNARRLAAAPVGPARDAVAASIEEVAAARADTISLTSRYLPIVMPGPDDRDRFCQQHHGRLDGPPG
jgi:hypothetical protein